ncbi:40S ribosomal protein mrp10 [Rhizina undulata]
MVREKVFRLPPLPKLRIRKPNKEVANPCLGVMTSVLGCWASQGFNPEGCAKLEEALRTCMDTQKQTAAKKSTINYHLSRLYPKLIGPHKRKR